MDSPRRLWRMNARFTPTPFHAPRLGSWRPYRLIHRHTGLEIEPSGVAGVAAIGPRRLHWPIRSDDSLRRQPCLGANPGMGAQKRGQPAESVGVKSLSNLKSTTPKPLLRSFTRSSTRPDSLARRALAGANSIAPLGTEPRRDPGAGGASIRSGLSPTSQIATFYFGEN